MALSKLLLKKIMQADMGSWSLYLGEVQLNLNRSISRRTKSSPFALFCGRPPAMLKECEIVCTDYELRDFQEWKQACKFVASRMLVMKKIINPAILEITEKYN